MMFCWSFSLTAIIGTVRCIAINFPFCRIKKSLVLSIAVGMAFVPMSVYIAMYFQDDEHVWSPYTLQVFPKNYISDNKLSWPFILVYIKASGNVLVSLASATMSVWGLKRADKLNRTKANEKRRVGKEAAITIAYLNILIGLQFILILMSIIIELKCPDRIILMNYTFFLTLPFSNTLISAINPFIYVMRCSKIKERLFRRAPCQVNRTLISENNTLPDSSSKK